MKAGRIARIVCEINISRGKFLKFLLECPHRIIESSIVIVQKFLRILLILKDVPEEFAMTNQCADFN